MAAVGAVWTRPAAALRRLGGLVAVALAVPRRWASLAVGLCARLGAALVGRRVLRRSYLGPLLEKSRVLAGASVTLHDVRSAPKLHRDLPRHDQARHFHWLEVTVRPRQHRPGVQRWSPVDLTLVAPEALPARPEEDEEVGRIFRAERWHRGRFVAADDSALYGPQRLRLQVGLLPNARQFRFRYYLELLRRHHDAPR
jgi:hypothetical protein